MHLLSVLCRSIVHLEIDNRLCSQNSGECFPSAESAAEYLGGLAATDQLRFPYPLQAVSSEYRPHAPLRHITLH